MPIYSKNQFILSHFLIAIVIIYKKTYFYLTVISNLFIFKRIRSKICIGISCSIDKSSCTRRRRGKTKTTDCVSPVLDSCHWQKKSPCEYTCGERCEAIRVVRRDTIGTLGETKGDQTAGSLYLPLFGCNTRVTLYSPANFPNDLVVLPVFSLNTGKLGDKPKPV